MRAAQTIVGAEAVRAAVLATVLVTFAGGCGAPTDPPPPPDPNVSLALGGTALDGQGFVPLAGDVVLVPGAQGGFHVWLKYRVTGMRPGPMRVRHGAVRVDDGRPVLVGQSRPVNLGMPGGDGAWEAPTAAPAFMCPAPVGIRIDNSLIRFRVELLDADDNPVVSGTAEATPHCPEGDQAEFCARICNG
jgi:hypothetical protein